MEQMKQLEKTIEGWLKPLPHLPAQWRKWLSDNAWWLTLIGVILDVFAMMGIYRAATVMDSFNTLFRAYGVTPANGWTTYLTVSMIMLGAMAVVMAMSISPLKAHMKKGWDLMFLATGISIVSSVLTALLGGDVSSLLMSLIGAAVGVYVLFELKSHFTGPVAHKEK